MRRLALAAPLMAAAATGAGVSGAAAQDAVARDAVARGGLQVAQAERTVSIPPQDLNSAILAFADGAGIQVFYDVEKLRGLRTRGVRGRYGAEQALRLLLAGTGVTYRFTGADTVTLDRAATQEDGAALELAPITVEARNDTGFEGFRAYDSGSATNVENVGAKVCHGSGVMIALRAA